ncbi:MAG: DUF998 domain-containing protein [Sphingomonas sp.]|jgi:hypothetical membrane protein
MMDFRENQPNGRRSTTLANAAVVFFCYFVLALLLMHLIRPDYTVVDHMISDYAVGHGGWIMTSAFVSISAGCLVLALGLFLDGPTSWLARIGIALLVVASAGLVVTAIFPTDLETAPSTWTGDIHTASFLVNIVSVFVSAMLLAVSYGGSDRWRHRQLPAIALTAVLLVAFFAQYFTLHRGAPYGLTNRFFVAVLMAWLISNALWLRRVAERPDPER